MATSQRTFEHIKTVNIPDPDFMPIFLQPCGPDHVIAIQTWCAYLLDVKTEQIKRVDYPPWAWNVGAAVGPQPALTIYFERHRAFKRCPLDVATGKIGEGEVISEQVALPTPRPPNLVTDEGIWSAHSAERHSLVASHYSRITDLSDEISRIADTDFFLAGPDGKVYLHRWDVGLLEPKPVDQPVLVINYRIVGCRDPRGICFDERGVPWIMDEAGPSLFEIDMASGKPTVHDLSAIHRETDDLSDPSPYPWHSCIWCRGKLVLGCCDAARLDILRPIMKGA